MVGKSKTATKTSPDPVDSLSKRKKSPGRPKSPARAKSPGRKSPARTSPARTKSESTKSGSEAPRTSTRTRSPARLRNATPPSTSKATPVLTPSRRSPIRRSPARTVKDFSEDFEKVDGWFNLLAHFNRICCAKPQCGHHSVHKVGLQ
ncbi:hypothetical protein NQ315_010610 [Exocentrus adspersus]|uniref:Uncharacterized protein n=1 Tax=Exocentrus adspersus TaxID=1586481 RepID=A0AAV8W524_9CUCU|nr:hypothetical protein NQ315_010610 [Exocentrus adspersus]